MIFRENYNSYNGENGEESAEAKETIEMTSLAVPLLFSFGHYMSQQI